VCFVLFSTFLDYINAFLQCFYLLRDNDDDWDQGDEGRATTAMRIGIRETRAGLETQMHLEP
jgi:hypothetical protein